MVVLLVGEVGFGIVGAPLRADTEVVDHRRGQGDLARVHLVLRVEQFLHLGEDADDPVTEHQGEELSPGLAVTVLPREGPPVGGDQFRRLKEEGAKVGDAPTVLDPERNTGVYAPVAEVAVDRGVVVPELREEFFQITQVVTEPVRGYRRVLPPRPGVLSSRRAGGHTEPGLPRRQDLLLLAGVVGESDTPVLFVKAQRTQQIVDLPLDCLLLLPAELYEQPTLPFREA